MKIKFFDVKTCPILGKSGSAYLALVVVPSISVLLMLSGFLLYSYFTSIRDLDSFQRARLIDLLSHMQASAHQKESLQELNGKLDLYIRSTPQPEFFKLHLFLIEGNTITASTDAAAVGKSLNLSAPILKPLSFRKGEATIEASVPVDTTRQLVAHEDITIQVAVLRRRFFEFSAVALLLAGIFSFSLHKLFRIQIVNSIRNLTDSVIHVSPEQATAISGIEVSREFRPLVEAWGQTVQHIGPAVEKLVEAEKKATVVLVGNSINHCIGKISDLLMPIAFLPSKSLSGSEINALKHAEFLLKQLRKNLENLDVEPEPLRLCQKLLRMHDTGFRNGKSSEE